MKSPFVFDIHITLPLNGSRAAVLPCDDQLSLNQYESRNPKLGTGTPRSLEMLEVQTSEPSSTFKQKI